MSSRREVLIRIPVLSQRKTLIETKNRTLKWQYWTVWSIKNVPLLTEDGAFVLFFRLHPGGFASSRVPTPGNLPSKVKKMLIPGGQPGGGGLGAGGIDWCITRARLRVQEFATRKNFSFNQCHNKEFCVFSLESRSRFWGKLFYKSNRKLFPVFA